VYKRKAQRATGEGGTEMEVVGRTQGGLSANGNWPFATQQAQNGETFKVLEKQGESNP